MSKNILIVDDESEVSSMISQILKERDYVVDCVSSGEEALGKFKKIKPDLTILDLWLPGIDGVETLKRIRKTSPEAAVVVLTAHESVPTAIETMKLGALDYLVKPLPADKIPSIVERILESHKLLRQQEKQEDEKGSTFERLIGQSLAMKKTKDLIQRAAESDITVFLSGESGTGKELVARSIHELSRRNNKPFVAIDCATLPESLVESELFGFEKGAFTGADFVKKGRFELAHGGTILLDEIGNLSEQVQIKLLRVLQEREIERLGGKSPIKIDIRLIVATNSDLSRSVREGVFREDLYHRIHVFPIALEPLRNRDADVLLFVQYFLEMFNKEYGKHVKSISPAALEVIKKHSWPGNVRELQNALRTVVLLSGEEVLPKDLPGSLQGLDSSIQKSQRKNLSLKSATSELEKKLISEVLKETNWNKSKATKLLGIDYKTLLTKIKIYNLERERERESKTRRGKDIDTL